MNLFNKESKSEKKKKIFFFVFWWVGVGGGEWAVGELVNVLTN